MIHPRDVKDMYRKYWWMRYLSDRLLEGIAPIWPCRGCICSKFPVFGRLEGYLLTVPLTARQISPQQLKYSPEKIKKVRKKILKFVYFAQDELKAEVIGLGALISSITEGGSWIVQHSRIKAAITHGDSYVVGVIQEAIDKMMTLGCINHNSVIGIVGATGLIGEEVSQLLCKEFSLLLVGLNEIRLKKLKRKIRNVQSNAKLEISVRPADLRKADLIITLTNAPGVILKREFLKPERAIIYDVAQPPNISLMDQSNVIRIDGGIVNINNIDLRFDIGLPSGITHACLAETIMQALENDRRHHVGQIFHSFIQQTKEWAKKYGFSHAPFTCFGKPVLIPDVLVNFDHPLAISPVQPQ